LHIVPAAGRRFTHRVVLVSGFALIGLGVGLPSAAAPILCSFAGVVEATGVAGFDASDVLLAGVVSPGDAIVGAFQFDPSAALARPGPGSAGVSVYDLAAPAGLVWSAGGLDFASHSQDEPVPILEDPPPSVLSAWVFDGPTSDMLVINAVSFADETLLHGLPGFVEIALFFTASEISWGAESIAEALRGLTPSSFTVQGLETANGTDVMWSFGGSIQPLPAVPEPASSVLLAAGLAALGLRSRRSLSGAQTGSDSTPK